MTSSIIHCDIFLDFFLSSVVNIILYSFLLFSSYFPCFPILFIGALALMDSRRELLLTTPRALDSPSGELFFRSPVMDAHQPSLFTRTLGDLPDTHVPCRNQVLTALFLCFNILFCVCWFCLWNVMIRLVIKLLIYSVIDSWSDCLSLSMLWLRIISSKYYLLLFNLLNYSSYCMYMFHFHYLTLSLSIPTLSAQASSQLSSLRSSWTVTTTSREPLRSRRRS